MLSDILKPVKLKDSVVKKGKSCRECKAFPFYKNVDIDRQYFVSTFSDKAIAFILPPVDFENLVKMNWKHIICSAFQDFDILFMPYPKCYQNAFDPSMTITILRNCRDTFIEPNLKLYDIGLVIVTNETKKMMELDDKNNGIEFPGNWGKFLGRDAYLIGDLWSREKRTFDSDGFTADAEKIKRFFKKDLLWQKSPDFKIITDLAGLEVVKAELAQQDVVSVDVEANDIDVLRKGFVLKTVGIYWPKKAYCIGYEVVECPSIKYKDAVKQFVLELFADKEVKKICHNLKYEAKVFMTKLGMTQFENCGDSMFLSYLFDENRQSNSLKALAGRYLDGYNEVVHNFETATLQELWFYNCLDACFTWLLHEVIFARAKLPKDIGAGIDYAYNYIMLPECLNLAKLELAGAQIDYDYLDKLVTTIKESDTAVLKKIDEEFPQTRGRNLGSSKQLGDVLFVMLKYPIIKRTDKGQAGTDQESLKELAEKHNCTLATYLLEHKKNLKFLSTYIEPYIENRPVYYNDRVRSNYMQVKNMFQISDDEKGLGTVTGRLCVAGDTLLQTDKGDFEISKIALHEGTKYSILTHKGRFREILNRFYKGKEQMYAVYLSDGRMIKSTGAHRFLTPDGWRHLYELKTGCFVETLNYSDNKRRCGKAFTEERLSFSNIRRSIFCSGFFNGKFVMAYVCRKIQHGQAYIGVFTSLLGLQVQKRIKNSIAYKLFKKYERKQTRPASASGIAGQGEATRVIGVGKEPAADGSGVSDQRIFYSKKYPTLWIDEQREIATTYAKYGCFLFKKFGNFCTRIIRLCKELLQRPACILYSPISGVSACFTGGMVYKESSADASLLADFRTDTKRPCLLEQQSLRSGFINGFTGGKHKSFTLAPYWRIFCRFLFSRKEVSGRNRWRFSSEGRGNNSAGCIEGKNANSEENSLFTIFREGRLERPEEGCANYKNQVITAIKAVGIEDVWDIEVEEDNSYVAHGFVNHNSSSGPNLQNIPRDKRVKKMFIPTKGKNRILLQADLSQAELRIAASLAFEENMLRIYKEGGDIHLSTGMNAAPAKLLAGIDQLDEVAKALRIKDIRQAAKCFVEGTLLDTNKGNLKVEDFIPAVNKGLLTPYCGDVECLDFTGEHNVIEATYYDEVDILIEFCLVNGDTFAVTQEHRMIVRREGVLIECLAKDVLAEDDIEEA